MRADGKRNGNEHMCAKDPEHARFIFTPLIGPCVAIMKSDLKKPRGRGGRWRKVGW